MGTYASAYLGYGVIINADGPWPKWIDEDENEDDIESQIDEKLAEVSPEDRIEFRQPGDCVYGRDDENYLVIIPASLCSGSDDACFIDSEEFTNAPIDEWQQMIRSGLKDLELEDLAIGEPGWLLWSVYC